MGCSSPKELSEEWPLHWDGCNYIPEDLHPKSFRGYFGHNTNVWATRNSSLVQVMPRPAEADTVLATSVPQIMELW